LPASLMRPTHWLSAVTPRARRRLPPQPPR
jgi:hypothetical protein